MAQATDAPELVENEQADSSLEEPIEPEPELTDPEEASIESKEPFLGIGLSASFTFDPNAPPQVRIAAPIADAPPEHETASAQSATSDAKTSETIEKLPQEEMPVPDVQTPYDSVQSQMNDIVTPPPSSEEATQSFAVEEEKEETITESLPTTESSALSEPIAAPVTDNENLDVGSESPSEEIDDIHSQTKQEELASESVAGDE